MDSITEVWAPPNTPIVTQGNATADVAFESTESLESTVYSGSPIIFRNSLPWALATLELEHRLLAEEDLYDTISPSSTASSPMDSADTSATSLLSEELGSMYDVETYAHPAHTTTRTVIRPSRPRSSHPLAFLRPSPVRTPTVVTCPSNSPDTSRPTSPVTRPVSPLNGTLKAFKLITDATLFEEDLDYYEHQWRLEQYGQGQMEIGVTKQTAVTVEYTYDCTEEEDQVVYPRRRLPSLLGPPVFTRLV